MRHIPVAIELGIRVALDRDSIRVGKVRRHIFSSNFHILRQILCPRSVTFHLSDGIRWNNVFRNSTVLQQLRVNLKAPGLRVSGETINSLINCAKERGSVEKMFTPANFCTLIDSTLRRRQG